jgi:CRISPR-associated protein Csd1
MALEPELQDRSYQYGRLLAVMEKVERDTYERDEKREPNAIRMQSVFVKRPAYAAAIIMNQLKMAYYPQLQPGVRVHYERLIGQIMEVISSCNHEENRELGETYLLGYYLQKNDMYKGKNTNSENEEMEE